MKDFGHTVHCLQETFVSDASGSDRLSAHASILAFVSKYSSASFAIGPVPAPEAPPADWTLWLDHIHDMWIDRRLEEHS